MIEICVSDLESVKQACNGGCTSLELCSNRIEGGVTPSKGFIKSTVTVAKLNNVKVHVLIRPRPGGFLYSDEEYDVIYYDIYMAKECGVDGIQMLLYVIIYLY